MDTDIHQHCFLTTKSISRGTHDVKIVPGDCGSELGINTLVTNENKGNLIGKYRFDKHAEGNSVICIETTDDLIGKNIVVRSPLYCIEKGRNFCVTCVGKD